MHTEIRAVVFDLFFTLVHPGTYPGGHSREAWLADTFGLNPPTVAARWARFESTLETGRAPVCVAGLEPELSWLIEVAAAEGTELTTADLERARQGWDLTRRKALLEPSGVAISTLEALRQRHIRIGVLSNTHALEIRAWAQSPLASLVDAAALSHELGVSKPAAAAYEQILRRLDVQASAAAYVGDGSNDELLGAKAAQFSLVVLAEEGAARSAPGDLPRLRLQADTSINSLSQILELLDN